jgi:hypothetical protein
MKESKLAEIIASFSKEELKSFEKFIASPYFSTGRDVSGLFSVFKKNYPDFNSPAIEKKNIFSSLFPSEEYNEKKLKNISSDLTKLAEQFLVHSSLKSSETEYDRLLAIQYHERKIDKHFLITINSLEKKAENALFDGIDCFRTEEEISRLKENHLFRRNDFDNSIKTRLEYIEYFTLSFLIKFIKELRGKLVITTRYNRKFESLLFDSVRENLDFEKLLETLREKNYSYLWIIELYYYSFMCTYNVSETKYYERFRNLFYENIERFTRFEKHHIFTSLAFYCIRQDETENRYFQEEELRVYKEMLSHDAYSISAKEHFNVVFYRNIMLIALRLGEHDWLEKFEAGYTGKLKPEFRENISSLVKASLDFARGRFDEALENISKIRYDLFLYKFDVKNLMLKIYYELDLYEQAFAMIDTYRHFLVNNKEYAEVHKIQLRNFIDMYNKLLKAKESGKKENAGVLLKKINETDVLPARAWFIEKVNELIN